MVFDVKRLDIYRKVPKDLTQPTVTGAVISVTCMIFMSLLFVSELFHFLSGELVSELYVDSPGEISDRIPVYIKLTIPQLKCEFLGLDIQDDLGRHEVGFVENTMKTPIGETGCLFEAKFHINKVPGNFHVSTHSAKRQPGQVHAINFSHLIHEVRFGDQVTDQRLPGFYNTLGNNKLTGNVSESHDYIKKLVPTIYEDASGKRSIFYQYTYVTRSYKSQHGRQVVPAIWFKYELNPITVKYHVKRDPFYTFVTKVCAIVGGTFTVAGIVDSFVFTASEMFKKFELGKLS